MSFTLYDREGETTIVGSVTDNTSLFTGNITVTGPGTAIDMTGYSLLSIQLSGSWTGNIWFESSHDNVIWDKVLIHSRDDVALQGEIDENGLYSIRASGKYLRYNVTNISGTIAAVMLGKTVDTLNPADKLSFAMDRQLNMPLYVEPVNTEKRDVIGAQIPSDAPNPILFTSLTAASRPLIIDTTGYQSIVIHSLTAGIITPTTSHDLQNWFGMAGCTATAPQTQTTTCAAAGIHVFPVTGRFVKLTGPATLVQALVYLRCAPAIPPGTIGTVGTVTSVSQWAGTAIVTAGLAGTLAVGGNVATGAAPTTNPLMIGGVDAGRLTGTAAQLTPKVRRALVDELGRFIPPNIDLARGTDNFNSPIANVRDTTQLEGHSQVELLAQILVELKVLTFQIHTMNSGVPLSPSDEPQAIREEYIKFGYEN